MTSCDNPRVLNGTYSRLGYGAKIWARRLHKWLETGWGSGSSVHFAPSDRFELGLVARIAFGLVASVLMQLRVRLRARPLLQAGLSVSQ